MAAGVVNIRRDVDDKFYRYRMPLLVTKIEGKGNGIKTVIPNMADIARALSRPPTYPTKFFGCELGAQTSFDEKNDRYIVNGAHDAQKLRELLDGFIDKTTRSSATARRVASARASTCATSSRPSSSKNPPKTAKNRCTSVAQSF
ncbi:hypothetical protein NM688_g9248 [Phlebia brevispora]|uniref:Uncharacterized protein n=1 Tax=Phlebia brevispora TaxID=194682 RepID=A0ACC1RJ93_9APHY|nr:hypothetical protein NM688_g9248 [Phlebia brevispora]